MSPIRAPWRFPKRGELAPAAFWGIAKAPVAQLDRAPDFESVGRTFESCRARQIYQGLTTIIAVGSFLIFRLCKRWCKQFSNKKIPGRSRGLPDLLDGNLFQRWIWFNWPHDLIDIGPHEIQMPINAIGRASYKVFVFIFRTLPPFKFRTNSYSVFG
mgnify:CR=1 FL=1